MDDAREVMVAGIRLATERDPELRFRYRPDCGMYEARIDSGWGGWVAVFYDAGDRTPIVYWSFYGDGWMREVEAKTPEEIADAIINSARKIRNNEWW